MDEETLGILITTKAEVRGFTDAEAAAKGLSLQTGQLTANYGTLTKQEEAYARQQLGTITSSKTFTEHMHGASVVLGDTSGQVDNLSRKLGGLSQLMSGGLGVSIAAIGATAAIGMGIELGKSAEAQSEANAKANADLAQSFRVQGEAVESYLPSINKWLDTNREVIPDVNQARDGLASFVRAGFDYPTAIDAMDASLNVAALKHIDLATASRQVLLGMEGNARGLKDLGIDLKSLTQDDENAIKAHKDFESATTSVATATKAQAVAVQHLSDVQAELKGKTTVTTAEQIRLRDAQQKVAETTDALTAANGSLTKAQSDVNASMSTAKQVLGEVTDKTDGGTKSVTDLERQQYALNRQWADFADKVGPDVAARHKDLIGLETTIVGKAGDMFTALDQFSHNQGFFDGVNTAALGFARTLQGIKGLLDLINGTTIGQDIGHALQGGGGVQGGGGWATQGGGWNP